MKILSVEPISYEIIKTDSEEWDTYRRSVDGSWEQQWGESWLPCDFESEPGDLDNAYKEWVESK